jgi:hypothetical protein
MNLRFTDSPNARSKSITTADGIDTFGVRTVHVVNASGRLIVYLDLESALYRKRCIPGWHIRGCWHTTIYGRCPFLRR